MVNTLHQEINYFATKDAPPGSTLQHVELTIRYATYDDGSLPTIGIRAQYVEDLVARNCRLISERHFIAGTNSSYSAVLNFERNFVAEPEVKDWTIPGLLARK